MTFPAFPANVDYNLCRAYVRDPKVYPDPETFNPERFLKDGKLDPNVQNPSNIVFGFGRR